MMYHFRISIHARPRGNIASSPMELAGKDYAVLQLDPARRMAPIRVSFEEAVARLEHLPRMFIEPDGSFVWVGQQGTLAWQLDGCLYDRDQYVVYVAVAGTCPPRQFDQLLRAFGWPDAQLVFQIPRHAVFLSERELRRYASGQVP